jgi:hypothetical protein
MSQGHFASFSPIFRVHRQGEERLVFYIDGVEVGNANHDAHGWSAMEDMCCLFERVAHALSAKIERTEGST